MIPELGIYTSPDPAHRHSTRRHSGPQAYAYAAWRPLFFQDPLGLYGTNDCSYYQGPCDEHGYDYYCDTAPYYCDEVFPKPPDPDPERDDDFEGWVRCVRQCLQDVDRGICSMGSPPPTDGFWTSANFSSHFYCYTACFGLATEHAGGLGPALEDIYDDFRDY